MADRILTQPELNRATLARQMLLERADLSPPAAVERLAGLQAQAPVAPYVGLWTRLRAFERDDLARAIEKRAVVKATLMRATLHLFTAEDYVRMRGPLQPALNRAADSIAKRRGGTFDVERVLVEAGRYIAETPRTFAEISAFLEELVPDGDVGAMRYSVRTRLHLVQVPIAGGWSYPGNPRFTLAEPWLGRPIPIHTDPRELVFRYLAAFGPATPADMQVWSGLARLKDVFERLRSELRVYRDERGRELFDIPDGPAPSGDSVAPARFLPPFDNLLMAHADRTRLIAERYRARLVFPNLAVPGTFLVDGAVSGLWRIDKTKSTATLSIEPFEPLAPPDRQALADEAEGLVRFVESGARAYEVRFQEPSRSRMPF